MATKKPRNMKKISSVFWFVTAGLALLVGLGSFFLIHKVGQGILWCVIAAFEIICGVWYRREGIREEEAVIIDNEKLR